MSRIIQCCRRPEKMQCVLAKKKRAGKWWMIASDAKGLKNGDASSGGSTVQQYTFESLCRERSVRNFWRRWGAVVVVE
jgi:hypothetical protein